MSATRWTYEPRPDTRTTNVRMGIWLFLASEAMFFGSLFSALVLLRAGATTWQSAGVLDLNLALVHTALLVAATVVLSMSRAASPRGSRAAMLVSTLLAAAFVVSKMLEYDSKLAAGLHPSASVMLACWFALTGVHVAHVAGGVVANLWVTAGAARSSAVQWSERLHALRLYWYFGDLVWLAILVGFYFV